MKSNLRDICGIVFVNALALGYYLGRGFTMKNAVAKVKAEKIELTDEMKQFMDSVFMSAEVKDSTDERPIRYYVIAEHLQHFNEYCRSTFKNPAECVHVHSPQQLCGLVLNEWNVLVKLPGFYSSEMLHEIAVLERSGY